jgi:WD40 repeat protein
MSFIRRFRFSLRTLLIAVLLLGSSLTLWLHWEPWYRQSKLTHKYERISFAAFTEDCKRVVWIDGDSVVHVTDAQTGEDISTKSGKIANLHTEGSLNGRPIELTAGPLTTLEQTGMSPTSLTTVSELPEYEEPWRAQFRTRHSKPITFNLDTTTPGDALYFLMTMLKEKFTPDPGTIDAERLLPGITWDAKAVDPLDALDHILHSSDLEAEWEDGALHIVTKTTFEMHRLMKVEQTPIVWDLESLKPIAFLSGQTSKITTLALSSNGKYALAASENGSARVWELPSGKEVSFIHTFVKMIERAAISDDGNRIALQYEIKKIGSWDVARGSNIFISPQTLIPNYIAISSDGSRACYAGDFVPELWDLNCGTKLRAVLINPAAHWRSGFEKEVHSKAAPHFSPKGDRLLADDDDLMFLLDAQTGDYVSRYGERFSTGQFSADGTRIAALGSDDATIIDAKDGAVLTELPRQPRSLEQIWKAIRGLFVEAENLNSPFYPGAPISPLPQFSPDGKKVIALDRAPDLGVWVRRRPERWWGVAWLPEFWLTAFLTGALVWSLRREWKGA